MASPQLENGYLKIANELWDALTRYRIPGEQMQCLLFILRKTYGWGKKEDNISLSQFVEATGMGKPHVLRATYFLRDKNIIVIKKDNEIVSYRINKDFESWEPLSKRVTTFKPESTLKKWCYLCGFKEVYERHHIIPRNEGGPNKNSNILHACPNCHSLIHKGKYSQKDLLPIKIKVETVARKDNGFDEKGKKPLSKKVPTKDSIKDTIKKTYKGEFKNVYLSDEEHQKLIQKFGDRLTNQKIESLSEYVASKGKKYNSHYATILSWDRKENKENGIKKSDPGYVDSFLSFVPETAD